MVFLIVLAVVALVVAVGALQKGEAVMVFSGQFEASPALVMLAATTVGGRDRFPVSSAALGARIRR